MEFHVSLTDRTDLAGEIYRQLRRAITEGRVRPGDALPPSRDLARQLGVSRTTVTVAYYRLVGEGFVGARVGAGTFVLEHGPPTPSSRSPAAPVGALEARSPWQDIPLGKPFARPAAFDFRSGLPDAALFPHDRWRRLLGRQWRVEQGAAGVYEEPGGHRGLREAIARHIGVSRAVAAAADDVLIVNGTQQALDLVARVLLAPGERVAMEDPGYPSARFLFQSLGLEVCGVPVDADGLRVDALPPGVRLVFVTPSHQYPLGMPMALSRRRALLAWADRHDAAILEDDYDSEFRFGGRPIEPLQTLDATGRVIYVGSFSKTLLPTLRLGFLVAPPSLRLALQKARLLCDWHSPSLIQSAVARFIDQGDFARHLRRLNGIYRRRHERLTEILSRDFAGLLEVVPSAAGLHVAALAPGHSVEEISSVFGRAAEDGVVAQRLAAMAVGARKPSGLVFGYGAIAEERIAEGLRRLRRAFDA